MLNWIYNWYDPARDVPVGELADQVSRLFLSGYRAGSDPAVSVPGAGESALGESRPSVW